MTKRKSEYRKIAATIRRHGIPQPLIADLMGVWNQDLNGFLCGRITVSPEREAAIKRAVDDVVKVLQTCPYRPDLNRVADVRKLIQQTNDREAQMVLPLAENASLQPAETLSLNAGS